jgi:hypothetical protein
VPVKTNPDVAVTPQNTPVTISVLANDTGTFNLIALSAGAVAPAGAGTAVPNPTGTITFTPDPTVTGSATFTYTIVDLLGTVSAPATVTVGVGGNTPPVVTPPANITVPAALCATSVAASDPAIVGFLAAATPTDRDGMASLTNDAPASFPLGTTTVTFTAIDNLGLPGSAPATVTFSSTDTCNLTGIDSSTVTIIGAAVDLDIASFTVTGRVRLSQAPTITLVLRVRNGGTVDGEMPATVVGVQNGVTVYNDTAQINDPVVADSQTFVFPPFAPTATGNITWTVTIFDQNPDVDTATRITRVLN